MEKKMIRFGIGGPVGAGKSHLLLRLCERLRNRYSVLAVTNDIYTREDAQFLTNMKALESGRIIGVETGGCPHAAIRDDISLNQDALYILHKQFPDADIAFIESGGDNLSATFSPDLVDYQIYIIDVAQGQDIPRKGGMGITRSDLLVVNKIDLAPYVDVDLKMVESDLQAARGPLPFILANMKTGENLDFISCWVEGLLDKNVAERGVPLWAQKPNLTSTKIHHDHDHEHEHEDQHHHHHG